MTSPDTIRAVARNLPLPPVLAANRWATNGELIADVARLGYLRKTDAICDPTYGLGVWWSVWRPDVPLIGTDLHPEKGSGIPVDFLHLPWKDSTFDVVAFDPPYKLNGTPDPQVDARYGVDVIRSWQGRHNLIREGMTECVRVLRTGGILLVKCMDQVCSGAVRWQTVEFTNHAVDNCGLVLADRFDMLGGGRPQPARTRADGKPSVQQHAYQRPSTLLVFRKIRS